MRAAKLTGLTGVEQTSGSHASLNTFLARSDFYVVLTPAPAREAKILG